MNSIKRNLLNRKSLIHVCQVMLCMTYIIGCSATQVKPDLDAGFRGIPWGESHRNVKEFELTPKSTEFSTDKYIEGTRNNEKLRFADTSVRKITYHFKNDHFYMATVEGRGLGNFFSVIRFHEKNHGKPIHKNEAANIYLWRVNDISINLRYYKYPNKFLLRYTSQVYKSGKLESESITP